MDSESKQILYGITDNQALRDERYYHIARATVLVRTFDSGSSI
jgi:hypothetical protein